MAFRDSWHRALVYFGLAEDRDVYEELDPVEPEAELEDRYRERPHVRRLGTSRRRRDEIDDAHRQFVAAAGVLLVHALHDLARTALGPAHPPESLRDF